MDRTTFEFKIAVIMDAFADKVILATNEMSDACAAACVDNTEMSDDIKNFIIARAAKWAEEKVEKATQ